MLVCRFNDMEDSTNGPGFASLLDLVLFRRRGIQNGKTKKGLVKDQVLCCWKVAAKGDVAILALSC